MMSSEDQPVAEEGEVDPLIWAWAEKKLGEGYVVEQVDTSKVKVTQKGVIYQGQGDWFDTQFLYEDVFTNDANIPSTWSYQECVAFKSQAKWRLTQSLKSNILPSFDVVLEFPGRAEGREPMSASFKLPHPDGCDEIKTEHDEEYPVSSQVTVNPYSTIEARVKFKTCRLRDALFQTDVIFRGPITVRGHKKRKFKNKVQTAASVESMLTDIPGFTRVSDSQCQTEDVFCTILGTCSGEVPVQVCADFQDLQSFV